MTRSAHPFQAARAAFLGLALLGLTACGLALPLGRDAPGATDDDVDVRVAQAGPGTARPEARPGEPAAGPLTALQPAAAPPSATAAGAVAAPASSGAELGRTIASLGAAAEPGQWLSTGLVTEVTPGILRHEPSGASVRVELRPSGRAPGSGSEMSLSAFRALGLSLTDLPELVVLRQ